MIHRHIIFIGSILHSHAMSGSFILTDNEIEIIEHIDDYLKENSSLLKDNTSSILLRNNNINSSCELCGHKFEKDDQIRKTVCQHLWHDECYTAWKSLVLPDINCPVEMVENTSNLIDI